MTGDIIEQKVTGPEEVEEGGGLDYRKSTEAGYNDKILNHEAKQGAEAEHNMGLLQALKTYRRAALWSIRTYTATNSPYGSLTHHGT